MSFSNEIDVLLRENDLSAALEACKAKLKAVPADREARHVYIDLLIVGGDYERADNQCGVVARLDPSQTMGLAMLRHHLRGMAARDAWFEAGALPQFPGGPTELDTIALRLGVAHRAKDRNATEAALAVLEDARGERKVLIDGVMIEDFRDLDDRIPHALEVIMSGGSYLWVDLSRVHSLELEPLRRPRDLAYRPAQLTLTDGATAPVLLPAIYHGTGKEDAAGLLGHTTEWLDTSTGLIIGSGQRCFLGGEAVLPLHELGALTMMTIAEAVDG